MADKKKNEEAQVLDPMELMEKSSAELKVKRSRRSVDWNGLPEEKKNKIGKQIEVNNYLAGQFNAKARNEVKFFEIDPSGSDNFTPVFHRGQEVKFTSQGEAEGGKIVGFEQTGSNTKFTYKDENGEDRQAKASGMSARIKTDSGSIKRVSLSNITVG